MLSSKLVNIILWVLIKYLIFYAFLAFKNDNYYFFKVNEIENGQDLFYYLWMLLFLPAVYCIVFLAPLYFIFKVKHPIVFLLLIIALFIAEYFLYTNLASTADFKNGLYNMAIGLLLLLLFFFKPIASILTKSIHNNKKLSQK
jgi:hypothetical protein